MSALWCVKRRWMASVRRLLPVSGPDAGGLAGAEQQPGSPRPSRRREIGCLAFVTRRRSIGLRKDAVGRIRRSRHPAQRQVWRRRCPARRRCACRAWCIGTYGRIRRPDKAKPPSGTKASMAPVVPPGGAALAGPRGICACGVPEIMLLVCNSINPGKAFVACDFSAHCAPG